VRSGASSHQSRAFSPADALVEIVGFTLGALLSGFAVLLGVVAITWTRLAQLLAR
jgi:hypothetical protein